MTRHPYLHNKATYSTAEGSCMMGISTPHILWCLIGAAHNSRVASHFSHFLDFRASKVRARRADMNFGNSCRIPMSTRTLSFSAAFTRAAASSRYTHSTRHVLPRPRTGSRSCWMSDRVCSRRAYSQGPNPTQQTSAGLRDKSTVGVCNSSELVHSSCANEIPFVGLYAEGCGGLRQFDVATFPQRVYWPRMHMIACSMSLQAQPGMATRYSSNHVSA